MKIKSIKQLKNLKGKKVLLRVDFNVPLTKTGQVGKSEDYRIVQTLTTINYLIKKGAKVIILAHLGRPDGKINSKYSLKPVTKRLSQLLKKLVKLSPEIIGKKTDALIKKLANGEILMLENIRFDKSEESPSSQLRQKLAKQLAGLGDIYINDAFAACHRDQASVSTIQKFLPSYAGLLLEQEIINLTKALKKPKKPLIIIIGGVKVSTKIGLIKNFLPLADKIILGGALANTVLSAKGLMVGKSKVEPAMFKAVKNIELTDNILALPVDGVFAPSYQSLKGRIDALADINKSEVILDIGPETVKLYEKILKSAKMVIWNGPMGLIETPFFAKGTKALIKILAKSEAETIVGGGETVQLIRQMKLQNKFSFISTGGGAMLEFLEGKKLPGLIKLIKN